MSSIVTVAFIILGMLIAVAGVFSILFHRRLAVNMERASIWNSARVSPIAFAVGLGIMQIALGLFIVSLSILVPKRLGGSDFSNMVDAVLQRMGATAPAISVLCLVSGGIGVIFGIILSQRAWHRRASWDRSSGGMEIPALDRFRLVSGTVLSVYGVIACGVGIVFLCALISS